MIEDINVKQMESVMKYNNQILVILKEDCKYQGLFNLMITQTNKKIVMVLMMIMMEKERKDEMREGGSS